MKLVHLAGPPFAILCCLIGPPAVSQTADGAAPATPAKPAMLEFDVPSAIIGPARDSIKRQLDSPSSRTRSISVPANAEPAPPSKEPAQSSQQAVSAPNAAPAAPVVPAAAPAAPAAVSQEVVVTAKSLPAPPIAATPLRLNQLKRLGKDEILVAATDKFVAYVLKGNERAVVLDFPTTLAQARMFGRVILFIEREGTSKSRVMTVPEVKKWLEKNAKTLDTLTMGNNIRVSEFTRFFNTARFQGEPLTSDEQELYDWLLQMQLLREEEIGVAVVEPEAIVVSVPQVSTVPGCAPCSVSAEQRRVTIEHEFSHARFATDIPYQNYVMWFWTQGMNAVVRSKFTQFLRKRGYDASIRELAANEMQAFLMHTPNAAAFSAADVGMTETELADLRRSFQAGLTPKAQVTNGKAYRLE